MSKPKSGLTLRDAILSGKQFKRPSWNYLCGDDISVIEGSTWGIENLTADDYILEQSDADKIKELKSQIDTFKNKQLDILRVCSGGTNFMWAANIASIIMDIDFRDVNENCLDNYIEKLKESK